MNQIKLSRNVISYAVAGFLISCSGDNYLSETTSKVCNIDFQYKSTIQVGGSGSAEITAFDPATNKLFIVNNDWAAGLKEISVYDISDINAPVQGSSIDLSALGSANSVSVSKGKLAIAVEAPIKQDPGKVLVYNTTTLMLENTFSVGALPDMLTFTHNGNTIVVANEGEPNSDYTNDPEGSVSIINLISNTVNTLDFQAFNAQEAALEADGFRVYGPGANLSTDVEPEYITISKNSKTAWVTLQENNGIAKINLLTEQIEAIYPLGFKDYSASGNEIDASDRDNEKTLKNWGVPLYGMYLPDAIEYVFINGQEYIITANEGDSRDYFGTPGYSEEARVKDVVLDPTVFPAAQDYQNDSNLGRLKITTTLGDTDNDGDYDELYSYGTRSFSVWSTNGTLLYDSGNEISSRTLALTPDQFNGNDGRSDDKGAEPEAVETLKLKGNKYVLFVGLERNNQVLVYDISNPTSPVFMQILSHTGDMAPEGILAISKSKSPSGKPLVIISNEFSGTVSIFENQ